MKIIKTPPAPESPLGYLYGAQESLNALARASLHRKELNNELKKIKDKGATKEQLDFCRYYYIHSEVKDWTELTKVFSIILEEVKGKPVEEMFGFIVNSKIQLFTDKSFSGKVNEEATRAHVKELIQTLQMTEEEKDDRLRNFYRLRNFSRE